MSVEDRFAHPEEVTDLHMAFGVDTDKLLPSADELPPWCKGNERDSRKDIICTWFYEGLPRGTKFVAREGVDAEKAFRHIAACLRSFQPKHEHKMAACAYLFDRWFSEVIYPDAKEYDFRTSVS